MFHEQQIQNQSYHQVIMMSIGECIVNDVIDFYNIIEQEIQPILIDYDTQLDNQEIIKFYQISKQIYDLNPLVKEVIDYWNERDPENPYEEPKYILQNLQQLQDIEEHCEQAQFINSDQSNRQRINERTQTSPNYAELDRVYYVKKAIQRSKNQVPDEYKNKYNSPLKFKQNQKKNRFSIQLSERGVNALPEIQIPDSEVDKEIEKELTKKLQTDRIIQNPFEIDRFSINTFEECKTQKEYNIMNNKIISYQSNYIIKNKIQERKAQTYRDSLQ